MKVTGIYMYPIKGLRAISLNEARLGPQGVQHDRRFMLCQVKEDKLHKMQVASHPQCSLFTQEIVDDEIHVRYTTPKEPLLPARPEHGTVLRVPLNPDVSTLAKGEVDVFGSCVHAYRMGSPFDDWFSACFGFETALMFIGDQRRPVLGTFAPPEGDDAGTAAGKNRADPAWIGFSDTSPFLFTSEQSLRNVSARLSDGDMDMAKFRPSIVVDGEGDFDEDFWSELSVNGEPTFALTKTCFRCSSINMDYETGRLAEGDLGIVLKKLMPDRRVDKGYKYAPVFGKYGFLRRGLETARLRVGDQVAVDTRTAERPVFDWPLKGAHFYQYTR
ncbi:hypothetical protein HIM_01397 [Hirsutella minnesotensis 3608]|nr:hypothetical protein HIM_01397 [Hirsutella minnesotensis 3608]